jgi:hypothetical protein
VGVFLINLNLLFNIFWNWVFLKLFLKKKKKKKKVSKVFPSTGLGGP